MEALSRPPHRRKHSSASSSSFSFNNPYGSVMLSRGDKAKFQPHEYAEIFSGSSSIPVLDLSGLKGSARPGGCRSSELDYSNIFSGANDGDVAVSHELLFNGGVKKNKTRIRADATLPFHENGSLSSSGKAKSSLGANGLPDDGISKQFNVLYNKTSQRSSSESNGKTRIAQLQAVPGFTRFVDDGTHQLQKKEGGKPVLLAKHEVSRAWSFSTGLGATTVKGGINSEKSHAPDKSWLPSFASTETAGENSPPLFDEELDENSDADVSIAALKKAIEQAQESMRLAKMIMQKKTEGIKDGSRARSSKGRPNVEDKKEQTEHASGSPKENNVTGKNQRSDPTFQVFTRVNGKSAPILSHSDNLLNSQTANLETVRENFKSASNHEDVFFEVDEKFTPSCSPSRSINTEVKDEMENIRQNVGASEPHGEATSCTGSVETVVLESGKMDCKDNICSTTKAGPCLDQMETDQETLEQGEPKERPEVFHRGADAASTSRSVLELERSPSEEAVEQCQVKGPANHAEQLERVLVISGSTQEHEKIAHGGGHLRISQKNEPPEDIEGIADKEKLEMKFLGHGELHLAKHLTVHNELLCLAKKNMVDEEDIGKQSENVSEWKEDGQDAKCSDKGKKGMVPKEEIIWFESELKVEGKISEREPGIFPVVGEAASKVDMVLKPEIGDEKLNFELEVDSQTVHGEHDENEIGMRCMDAAQCEPIETIQIGTNSDSDQNGRIPLDVEDLNHSDGAAGRRKNLQDNGQELNDSTSEKDTSEAFAVHSNDPGIVFSDSDSVNTTTFYSEIPEPCGVDFKNKAGECQTVLRGCEEKYSLPQETETFLAVEENEAGKPFELELTNMPGIDSFCRNAFAEKFTLRQFHQLKNVLKGFSSDFKSTSVILTNADHEKTPPSNEDMFKTATEIHSTAQDCAAQVEKIDNTNLKPDLHQNSENSEESQSTSNVESVDEVSTHESPACRDDANDISSNKEEVKDDLDMKSDERVDAGKQSECLNAEDQSHLSQTHCKPKEIEKPVEAERDIKTGQDMEENVQNLGRTSTSEKQDAKGNEQKCQIDSWQRIEAIRRGREREKDIIAVEREREKERIAVERAIREVRERAFAEARERAERAAVERAAADAQQRVMGEVREKNVKASVDTKPSVHKVSTEAKLRVERAAVERATAEARERALEKAMSQKNSNGARVQAAKYSAERSSSSSRNNGLNPSSSYSDLEKSDGATSESAQRRKARLERHQRIMERAAKALAEKNARDLLSQKEQAERSRLAESLDADIKRWATGKEGNLRALLSTLQYILGPESAWQPVSLTEIVTAAAVKKTYRKATLCVHPDKLQQRGASIQHKYICEKIFDLLKAAWNRFNSEEN